MAPSLRLHTLCVPVWAQSEAAINSNESLLLESEQQRLRADNQLLHVEMERLDRIVYGRDASSVMPRCGATQTVP